MFQNVQLRRIIVQTDLFFKIEKNYRKKSVMSGRANVKVESQRRMSDNLSLSLKQSRSVSRLISLSDNLSLGQPLSDNITPGQSLSPTISLGQYIVTKCQTHRSTLGYLFK